MPKDNAVNLENAVVTTLAKDRIPTEDEVLSLATALRHIPNYVVSDEEFSDVIRRLHARLQVNMDTGTAIVEPYQSWLPARSRKSHRTTGTGIRITSCNKDILPESFLPWTGLQMRFSTSSEIRLLLPHGSDVGWFLGMSNPGRHPIIWG